MRPGEGLCGPLKPPHASATPQGDLRASGAPQRPLEAQALPNVRARQRVRARIPWGIRALTFLRT